MKKTDFNNNNCLYRRFWGLVLLMIACNCCREKSTEKEIDRSFYYWKSIVKLTDFELRRLDSLHVKTIYLKFFDVDWDAVSGTVIPKAKLQIQDNRPLKSYRIVPTVFIVNAALEKIDSTQTIVVAQKIYGLIKTIAEINHLGNTAELQIDCDWTAATSKKYFSLLRVIKTLSNTSISATIRLHQVKYLSGSGVPPVDRGMLMCYNMGNLRNASIKNSIIENNELKKYTANLSAYPLPLDVALPLFEWKVLFRDNIYRGLLQNMRDDIFTNTFTAKNGGRTVILKDTLLNGYELKKGDVLRTEDVSITEIKSVAQEINKQLKNPNLAVSFYHLDSVTLNKFTKNELESIYSIFR